MIARTQRPKGFTLVELLVVIGIIALLISILLPSLSAARRQANQVKCATALRQIFNGFKMYEMDNRGYWPVARVTFDTANRGGLPIAYGELHWTDFISKYMHKDASKFAGDMGAAIDGSRRRSVLWGCPEYSKTEDFSTNAAGTAAAYADSVRNGYGMTHYVVYPHVTGTNAYVSYTGTPTVTTGTWQKQSVWTRKEGAGSAARGLIADSNLVWIDALSGYSKTKGGFQMPGSTVTVPTGYVGYVNVDAGRHLKQGRTVDQARQGRGINLVYRDGHVDSVTPGDAWGALRNGGLPPVVP